MRLVLAAIAVQSVAGQTFPTGVTLSCNVLDGCLGAVAFWQGKINVWWECSEGDCFWMNDPQNGQSNGAGTLSSHSQRRSACRRHYASSGVFTLCALLIGVCSSLCASQGLGEARHG